MNEHNNNADRELTPGGGVPEPLPGPANPELDSLLRQWHQVNAARAAAGREKLLASIAAVGKTQDSVQQVNAAGETGSTQHAEPKPVLRLNLPSLMEGIETDVDDDQSRGRRRHTPNAHLGILRSIMMNRFSPLAAALLLLASVMSYFVVSNFNQQNGSWRIGGGSQSGNGAASLAFTRDNTAIIKQACFDKYVMAPDGGRLDAVDGRGNVLGPCILKHTDVEVNVAGFLNRVNIKQVYLNPHSDKIEAVYTFPLSERAAVDRMTMTIGSRVIEGQVKERTEAKRIYEQAKAQGRVASLLEQERPNIFTQSIANIEPAAEIVIEISYVEVLEQRDGQYSITFPITIAPRYIPGEMMTWDRQAKRNTPPSVDSLPPDLAPRRGIVLIGPAQIVEMQPGDTSHGSVSAAAFGNELAHSRPVRPVRPSVNTTVWYNFVVKYDDGSKEIGTLYTSGAGVVNGRAFFSPTLARKAGAWPPPVVPQSQPEGQPDGKFAAPTAQVPDAARITPMPVKPPMRAGQDISITVNIDTGGPAIANVQSQLHEVDVVAARIAGDDAPAGNTTSRKTIRLRNQGEIPNRDFTLAWNVAGGIDSPMVLTHTAAQGNFFFVSVLPPERADDSIAVPREIMFVLDRSGSMKGFKIEQAKALIDATLTTLRPFDTFNVLAFSNTSEKLWPAPRPATPENLAQARAFYGRSEGQGATEMLRVISEALATVPFAPPAPQPQAITPEALSNLPADGREVIVDVPNGRLVKVTAANRRDLPTPNGFVPSDKFPSQPENAPPPNAIPRHGNIPAGHPGNEARPTGAANAVIRMGVGVPDIKVRISDRLFAIKAPSIRLAGTWNTENGDRIFNVTQVDAGDPPAVLTAEQLSSLPADGREVVIDVPADRLKTVIVSTGRPIDSIPYPSDFPPGSGPASDRVTISLQNGASDIRVRIKGNVISKVTPWVRLTGKWTTQDGDRLLDVTHMGAGDALGSSQVRRGNPIRLVAFITDGEVGNDMEVLAAVKQYRGTARVFSFAIGDSPNRYLLDGMARLGRGEVDYVPLNADARDIIARFTRRVSTPVLTDIHATFSQNIQPVDVLTALGGGGGSGERISDFEAIPDLYDQKPVVIVGRYNASGAGSLTITGNTAVGPWSKTVNLTLPAAENKNNQIATLWARTKVESIMDNNLVGAQRNTMAVGPRSEIITLGESFNIVTQYTNFVAVDRLRVTIGGQPRLVHIPVDFPQGAEWSGYFGGGRRGSDDEYSDLDKNLGIDLSFNGFTPVGGVQDSLAMGESLHAGETSTRVNINTLSLAEAYWLPPVEGAAAANGGELVNSADTQAFISMPVLPAPGVETGYTTRALRSDRERAEFNQLQDYATSYPSPPALRRSELAAKGTGGGTDLRVDGKPVLRTTSGVSELKKEVSPADKFAAATTPSGGAPDRDANDEAARKQRSIRAREPSQPAPVDPKPGEKSTPASEPGQAPGRSAGKETPPPPPTPAATPATPAGDAATTTAKDESNDDGVRKNKLKMSRRAYDGSAAPSKQPAPAKVEPDATGGKRAGEDSSLESERERTPSNGNLRGLQREVGEGGPDATRAYDSVSQIDLQGLLTQTRLDSVSGMSPFAEHSEESVKVVTELNSMFYKRPAIREARAADGSKTPSDRSSVDEASKTPAPVQLPPRPIRREEIAMHIGALARKSLEDPSKLVVVEQPAPSTVGLQASAEPVLSAAPTTVTDQKAAEPAAATAVTSPVDIAEAPKPLDEARKWTMAFYEVFKTYDVASHMKDVFLDETLDDYARATKLVELGDKATGELKNLVRDTKFRRRLQHELVPFALGSGFPETLGGAYDGEFPKEGIRIDSGLLVSLIVEKSDEAMLKKLADAGLRVESHDDQINVIVGVAPLGKLASVVLVDGVRKMEMTKE